jgi:6-phosphogluconolactonase
VIKFHAFDDAQAQASALAQAVGAALDHALARHAERAATLAVSGGTSPRRFLQTLSGATLDWTRVAVTLVDERWVAESDDASNARLVRETLLQGAAQAARFMPLADTASTLAQQIATLNAQAPLPDVAVLGMGEDGHTASLFADAPEWEQALTTPERFVAVHPGAAPHARVSLSFEALTQIDQLFLQISGSRKREVLYDAASALRQNAISRLVHDKRTTLHVYWCN